MIHPLEEIVASSKSGKCIDCGNIAAWVKEEFVEVVPFIGIDEKDPSKKKIVYAIRCPDCSKEKNI